MEKTFSEISGCEVCGSVELHSVLDLGMHPMCDDLIPVGDSRVCEEYPIEILYCVKCFTAHQHFQVPKKKLFPESYHYRSRFTADVLSGMKALVKSCEERFGSVSGKTVLDIGCNDGSLLDYFAASGARTIGVEPTGACREAEVKGHATINDYLSKEVAEAILKNNGQPDFISFTNVFAHIENLRDVIESLQILIGPSTVLVIENHYLGSVLDGYQFDTFYHEHPRTYSFQSFVHIAKSLGAAMLGVEFPSRYGGNIRVFLGSSKIKKEMSSDDMAVLKKKETAFLDCFNNLNRYITHWKEVKRQSILEYVDKQGPLMAKAFPGRAAILIKLLELDENHISAVYEKSGSMKIGHYIPGTRIPIYSDDELFSKNIQNGIIVNLAWHLSTEIREYLVHNSFAHPVVDILSPDDFLERSDG